MKAVFKYIICCCSCLLASYYNSCAQSSGTYCSEAQKLISVLNKNHYSPLQFTSQTSNEIIEDLIEKLDPSGIYFTLRDIEKLKKFRTDLNLNSGSCELFSVVFSLYRNSLVRADSMVERIGKKQFAFNGRDTLIFSPKKNYKPFHSGSESDLEKRWLKWMKYQTLLSIFSDDEKNTDFEKNFSELMALEPEARKNITRKMKAGINRILHNPVGFENHVASVILNCIANRFDPHSVYFNENDMKIFESALSTSDESFGFYLETDDHGALKIARIIPGGSAWKSNELHKGDVLISIKKRSGEEIEIDDLAENEVEDILSTNTIREIELTVRKADEQVKHVTLVKEKIKSEENVVKSYILSGPKKIGYISLPSFYTDSENPNAPGCANDVAKEIMKLQQDSIEGLILDLRYNGGGSVREALDLAGIFIDEGPLFLQRLRDQKPTLLKDMNRGTAYSGPLAIMCNGYSASASELVTEALQDYNRAIIVGSTTYGKATGQIVLPLDSNINIYGFNADPGAFLKKDSSFVKVTVEKFYRVNGGTHQFKGVIPDIILPDLFFSEDFRESSSPWALKPDTIVKKVYYTPLKELPKKQLKEKSGERVASSKNFSRIKTMSDSLQLSFDKERRLPVTVANVKKDEQSYYHFLKALELAIIGESGYYTVKNNSHDNKVLIVDEYSRELNNELLEHLKNDIYIEESYRIITDLINFER